MVRKTETKDNEDHISASRTPFGLWLVVTIKHKATAWPITERINDRHFFLYRGPLKCRNNITLSIRLSTFILLCDYDMCYTYSITLPYKVIQKCIDKRSRPVEDIKQTKKKDLDLWTLWQLNDV